jgi:putative addiction module CopG family antidote
VSGGDDGDGKDRRTDFDVTRGTASTAPFAGFVHRECAGSYQTASEVVREALRLLKHRDEGLVQLRGDIQAGLDQAARGEYTAHGRPSLSKLAARVKTRGRKRLAALKVSKRSTGR